MNGNNGYLALWHVACNRKSVHIIMEWWICITFFERFVMCLDIRFPNIADRTFRNMGPGDDIWYILKNLYLGTACILFRIGTSSWPFWTLFWNFGVLKRRNFSLIITACSYSILDIQVFIYLFIYGGAHGGAVGWGIALQVGRSRVRFPMWSLEFFIEIILPAAQWPWGWLSL